MAYNIFYIEQVNISGSLIPELPYYITNGDRNDKSFGYFETEEQAQTWINNN